MALLKAFIATLGLSKTDKLAASERPSPSKFLFGAPLTITCSFLFLSSEAQAQIFSPLSLDFGQTWRGLAVWADFDNDNDLDLIVMRTDQIAPPKVYTRLYRNDGNERFAELDAGLTGVVEGNLVVGDVDRDGFLDIALSGDELDEGGWGTPRARIFRNLGNLRFELLMDTSAELPRGPMDLGDYDRDGDLDILHAGQNPYFSPYGPLIQTNNGSGSFAPVTVESPRGRAAKTSWEDYDRDGELDAVFAQTDTEPPQARTIAYRNAGENRFLRVFSPDDGLNSFSIRWADLDGDGYLDAVGPRQDSAAPLLLRNDGKSGFTSLARVLLDRRTWSVAIGDADNDGDFDGFFLAWDGDGSRLGLNDGAANFMELDQVSFPSGFYGSYAAWGDHDNDGDLDLIHVTSCQEAGCQIGTTLYRNDFARPNTKPLAPVLLSPSQLANGDVKLEWSGAADAQTTNDKLLTYEVRLGTAPGKFDIIAPPADPVTGFRRVARTGSERASFRYVRNLPKGRYYWSVQAVDTAFVGSVWASEQSFVVTNTAPVISAIPPQQVAMSKDEVVRFSILDAESPGNIGVRVESENEELIPNANLRFSGGSDSDRTLTYRSAPGKAGVTRLVIIAADRDGLTTRRSFQVTVEEFTLFEIKVANDANGLRLPPSAPADYDGDGDLDVFISGSWRGADGFIWGFQALLKNNGLGSFTTGPEVPLSEGEVQDFDRDGDSDVGAYGSISLNNGDGNFVLPNVTDVGAPASSGDINGDGALDWAFRSSSSFIVWEHGFQFTRGEKSETRPIPLGLLRWGAGGIFHLADFDQDGDLDLLSGLRGVDGWPSNTFAKLFSTDGGGNIDQTTDLPDIFFEWWTPPSWVDDIDDDGDLDIGVVDGLALVNDGRGNFSSNRIEQTYSRFAFDFDNDGDRDPILYKYDPFTGQSRWELYRRNVEGFLALVSLPKMAELPRAFGDFDGDGDLDFLAVVNPRQETDPQSISGLYFFRNNCDRTNQPPSAPVGLQSAVDLVSNRLTVSWQRSSDDNTPEQLLTYNLRIGTKPGGINFYAPTPLSAQSGNNGTVLRRTFAHLPPGKYYWSVQALDAQFKAGAWAPEQTFTIDRPAIAPIGDVVTPPNTPSRPVSILVSGDSTSTAEEIIVTATSESPEIVPNSGLLISGSGERRTLELTPANRDGEAFIEVTAKGKNGSTFSRRFLVTVRQFEERLLDLERYNNTALQWLDLDGDGDLDLLSAGTERFGYADVALWENQPGSEMVLRTNALPLDFRGRVFVGDANQDNRPDLFLSGVARPTPVESRREARLWSSGTGFDFTPQSSQLTNLQLATVFMDRGGDKRADLAAWAPRNQYGPGSELFVHPEFGLSEQESANICAYVHSDLDGDGDLDVLLSIKYGQENQTNLVRVWSNDGAHYVPVETALPSGEPVHLAATDLDGDGLPEIFFARLFSWPDKEAEIWKNLGNFRFERTPARFPWFLNGAPAPGDYDGDGDPDLLMTRALTGNETTGAVQAEGPVTIYRNVGTLAFERADLKFPLLNVNEAAWGDFDNDGDLDFGVVGDNYGTATRLINENASFRSNSPPTAPEGLTSAFINNGVLLSWNPASDSEDSRFLTYNLRVGVTPGGSEILSALADPASGRRRVSTPGNAGSAPRWRILGLTNGTYYWSVQAVDAGYAGSRFAPERTFQIHRAVLAGLTNISVAANYAAGPFNFTIAGVDPQELSMISVTSSNEALIRSETILLSRSGTNWGFKFAPEARRSGRTTLLFTARSANGGISSEEIEVLVRDELELIETQLPPFHDGVAAWADVDGDGDLDLLAGGFTGQPFVEGGGRSEIWRNDQGTITVNRLAMLNDAGAGDVAFADPDNDGLLDLVVSGGTGGTMLYSAVARNNPGSLRQLGPSTRSALAWGDLDSDGRSDLVVSGSNDSSLTSWNGTRLYQNRLPSAFFSNQLLSPGLRDGAVLWFDADRDGDDDLLLKGSKDWTAAEARTVLFLNHAGVLIDAGLGLPNVTFASAAVADYNLDDFPDILIFGGTLVTNGYTQETLLLQNDGAGHFMRVTTPFSGFAHGAAAWGDYDSDGDPDLILSGLVNDVPRTELWINNDGVFSLSDNRFNLHSAYGAAWGDMDGDGDLDLALVGPATWKPRFTGLFRNTINHRAEPPPIPVDLRATPDGTDVILSWRMPVGAPRGLSFNIRAGTTPGAIDIMSPLSDVQSGRRLLPKHGNASWSMRKRLRGHAGRPLFWSVQAINPAFVGSPFSAEHDALVARNESPVISPVPLQIGAMNQPFGPLEISISDPDNRPDQLEVTFSNSSRELVQGVDVTGAGGTRSLIIRPFTNATGVASIVVTARDPLGASSTNEVRVAFRAVTEVAASLPQYLLSSFEPGDYDHDGFPDLFLAGWEPTGSNSGAALATVLRNVDGTFLPALFGGLPVGEVRGIWGDADGDGDLDLAIQGGWARNDLNNFVSLLAGPDRKARAAWGDIDNDGDLDAIYVGGDSRSAVAMRNVDGTFEKIRVAITPVSDGALAFGDADNDGDLDLAITGRELDSFAAYPRLRIYRNEGGTFLEVTNYIGISSGTLQWADANNDGRPDILMAGSTPVGNREDLFRNRGGFTFGRTNPALPTVGAFPGAMLFDFDNDGDLDLAEHTGTSMFAVRLNDGSGTFSASSIASANTPSELLRIADVDLDGDFDILVSGPTRGGLFYDGAVNIYRNHWLASEETVHQLTANVSGKHVQLKWPKIANAKGPGTYNLRVGTRPGGIDVVSPQSDPSSGHRLVPTHGNMGFSRQTTLGELPRGTYYWSIQPVDSSWIGGPFNTESQFTVGEVETPLGIEILAGSGGVIKLLISAPAEAAVNIERSSELIVWSFEASAETDVNGKAETQVQTKGERAYFRLRSP